MANVVYPLFRQDMGLDAIGLSLTSDAIHIVLVKSSYVYSASHETYAASVQAHKIGGPVTLTSVTWGTPRAGVFDAADATFSAVPEGNAGTAVIGFFSSDGTLIFHIDSGTNLPVTPPTGGGDINFIWPNTNNRIFAIGAD